MKILKSRMANKNEEHQQEDAKGKGDKKGVKGGKNSKESGAVVQKGATKGKKGGEEWTWDGHGRYNKGGAKGQGDNGNINGDTCGEGSGKAGGKKGNEGGTQ